VVETGAIAERSSARPQPRAVCENFTAHLPASRPRLGHTGPRTVRFPDRSCRIGSLGRLVKVWVDAAADDRDRGDSRFFEGHVIAAGEKPIEVEFVAEPRRLTCLGRHALDQSRHADREPPIADPGMVDVDHAVGCSEECQCGVSVPFQENGSRHFAIREYNNTLHPLSCS